MILANAIPKLEEAISKAVTEPQEVPFIYNELLTLDTIILVFEWLFRKGIDFKTRHDEFRFVIEIQPPQKH